MFIRLPNLQDEIFLVYLTPMVMLNYCNCLFKSVVIIVRISVVSSNPIHGELYSIQHYVIKIVSDLRQVGGFLR